jgi:dTDP-4-amino-4,6-dideoxygalactose transaminase
MWDRYHAAYSELEADGRVRRPVVPTETVHNAHMYYLLLPDLARRTAFIESLRRADILSVFHYVPLHSSPVGRVVGRTAGDMANTDAAGERLVRLPLWLGLEQHLDDVIAAVIEAARAG